MDYCVFVFDQKFHKYYIYHSNDEYEESLIKPNHKDNFEFSKLTKYKINEQLEKGITLKEILKNYCKSFLDWRNELYLSQSLIKKYDFFLESKKDDGTKFINTNESNIMRFFNNYSSKIYKNDTFKPINWIEYLKYEQANNNALQRCIPGEYNCLGYDLTMAYPHMLSSQITINKSKKLFLFPIVQGTQENIKTLKNLKYGLYDVEIKCINKEFLTIFDLNKNNVYTHYDINFCLKHQKTFDIEITLLNIDKLNCLTYLNKDCVDGEQVFKMWLDRIIDLKKEFPKNGLIKLISSSIWGYLSKINKRYYNDKELDEHPEIKFDLYDSNEINYLMLNEKDNKDGLTTDYQLINKSNPYCKNYRLKPFLQSFSRLIMAEIAIEIGINKIVRINTDNITFNKDLLSEKDIKKLDKISPQFIQESKTTGKFYIKNVNKFIRL